MCTKIRLVGLIGACLHSTCQFIYFSPRELNCLLKKAKEGGFISRFQVNVREGEGEELSHL